MMHGDWGVGIGYGWPLMMLFWLLVWGLLIAGFASLFSRGGPRYSADSFDPRRIVQERYAKGEISREEYLALMNDFK